MEIQPQSRRFSLWMWVGRGCPGHRAQADITPVPGVSVEYPGASGQRANGKELGKKWALCRQRPFLPLDN